MKSLSRVRLFATPWTVAYQAPPSMGFSRQEYWSGVPLPSPGDLPNPGIEPGSPALQADALPSEPPGKLTSFHFMCVTPPATWRPAGVSTEESVLDRARTPELLEQHRVLMEAVSLKGQFPLHRAIFWMLCWVGRR